MESSNIQPKVNHFTWGIPSWFHWFPRCKTVGNSKGFHLEIPSNQTLHNENPSNQPWSGKFSMENRVTMELVICHNIRNRWRPLVHIHPKFLRIFSDFSGGVLMERWRSNKDDPTDISGNIYTKQTTTFGMPWQNLVKTKMMQWETNQMDDPIRYETGKLFAMNKFGLKNGWYLWCHVSLVPNWWYNDKPRSCSQWKVFTPIERKPDHHSTRMFFSEWTRRIWSVQTLLPKKTEHQALV